MTQSDGESGSSPLARGTPARHALRHRGFRFIPARAGNTGGLRHERACSTVHPRSRGEHPDARQEPVPLPGSSPLARGTLVQVALDLNGVRFIPARAGNTCRRQRTPSTLPVHPRSRGEHGSSGSTLRNTSGSSPLARGTPGWKTTSPVLLRFIPARAGNTAALAIAASDRSVHPRSRGEHNPPATCSGRVRGSSPLARGTRKVERKRCVAVRFIPARAGNTPSCRAPAFPGAVHPRSRGEHCPCHARQGNEPGSSPLARGTPHVQLVEAAPHRFIPARAGNTLRQAGTRAQAPVHPRSRGEHSKLPSQEAPLPGSSPLARGTLARINVAGPVARFIPARAGNTHPAAASSATRTVHPRSRGEHEHRPRRHRVADGSSPLARGTRTLDDRMGRVRRFIPARAGNTRSMRVDTHPCAVHPRSRGEHLAIIHVPPEIAGSSPLARGTLHRDHAGNRPVRFIPARAGNTR